GRIPGHQPPAGRHPAGHEARRPRPDRGGRRRAVDLFVPRRHGAQYPRFPVAVRAPGPYRHARAQLPLDQPILDASNAVIGLARERYTKNLWTDRASTRLPALVTVSDEAGQARWVADQVLARREEGATLKSQAALFRA